MAAKPPNRRVPSVTPSSIPLSKEPQLWARVVQAVNSQRARLDVPIRFQEGLTRKAVVAVLAAAGLLGLVAQRSAEQDGHVPPGIHAVAHADDGSGTVGGIGGGYDGAFAASSSDPNVLLARLSGGTLNKQDYLHLRERFGQQSIDAGIHVAKTFEKTKRNPALEAYFEQMIQRSIGPAYATSFGKKLAARYGQEFSYYLKSFNTDNGWYALAALAGARKHDVQVMQQRLAADSIPHADALSFSFLLSVMRWEGMTNMTSRNPHIAVGGFDTLGLDNFADLYPVLKKRGYIFSPAFKFRTDVRQNELGNTVNSAVFSSLANALEAFAARLAYTQEEVYRTLHEHHVDIGRIPVANRDEFIAFMTYMAWNAKGETRFLERRIREFHGSPEKLYRYYLQAMDEPAKVHPGSVRDHCHRVVVFQRFVHDVLIGGGVPVDERQQFVNEQSSYAER